MAVDGKGQKRSVYFTCSTGKLGKESRAESSWKPGRSKNKFGKKFINKK